MITKIRTEIIGDPALSVIVDTRVFYRNPINEQTQPYITFIRSNMDRNDVQESDNFQFICFSSDMTELETMTDGLISLFEGTTIIDDKLISQVEFISVTDSASKVETNGFFFNIITLRFVYAS